MDSDELFESAFQFAAIGMALLSLEGRWLKVNNALCAILGRTESELLDTTFQEITYPEDLPAQLAYLRQLTAGEIPTFQMEKRYLHKSGRLIYGLLSTSLVRGSSGVPKFLISQIQDITPRIQAELAHRASENRYRLITDNSTDLVALHRADTSYAFISPSARFLLGYSPEELIFKKIFDLAHPEDHPRITAAFEHALRSDFSEVTYRILHRQGHIVWLETLFRLAGDDSPTIKIQSASRDVSRRKLAEEELQTANDELNRTLREVKELRGIIPICAYCKSIRNDQNYWQQLETYLAHHTDARLSHGICPQCLENLSKNLPRVPQKNPEK